MKKTEIIEIKKLDIKGLLEKSYILQKEISQLLIDKSVGKLKDLKVMSKKRHDRARVLTILKQKQLLESLEAKNAS